MAIFRIQLFKRVSFSDREWSNTYLVEAADLATASAGAAAIANREKAGHGDNVTLVRARISDDAPETDVFNILPLGLIGTAYAAVDQNLLPLYNTVRVDIGVSGGGRPSRKYFRSPIPDIWHVDSVLNPSIVTLFNTMVAGIITDASAASAVVVDPDGQEWVTPQTQSAIQMRQLHRKRKKAVV